MNLHETDMRCFRANDILAEIMQCLRVTTPSCILVFASDYPTVDGSIHIYAETLEVETESAFEKPSPSRL
jgi:hypothetical protein